MNIDFNDILSWDNSYRLRFINSISGYKGAHLIGTKSNAGISNLGVFNSVVHINSNPPQIGFIMRPLTVERHTYLNIIENQYFTINHIQKSFLKKAHYTSAKLDHKSSEFEACQLTEQYIQDIPVPFVEESKVKIGLKLIEDVEIKSNGCRLIIGEIQVIDIVDECVEETGQLDFSTVNSVCVTGLNQYSTVSKFIHYPYVRQHNFPNFKEKERPDNVVFDEETQTYNSSLLPYGTNIGAPSIKPFGVSTWKNKNISSFNHIFNNKVEQIKADYSQLIEEYKTNEILYGAKMNFEPIIGQTYHLYLQKNNTDHFLSLIHPDTWKSQTYKGSFQLNSDKTWIEVDTNS